MLDLVLLTHHIRTYVSRKNVGKYWIALVNVGIRVKIDGTRVTCRRIPFTPTSTQITSKVYNYYMK